MKKLIIIGGGISGLTAGIYAQKMGFESVIFEKHKNLGGECTGWNRGDYYIDGCIHWLTGTKEGTELNKIWKQVGALENVEIYQPETFLTIEYKGERISINRDLTLFKLNLLELSPVDKKEINKFISYIKKAESMQMPCEKPFDMMSAVDFMKLGKSMKGAGKVQKKMSHISVEKYCKRFKSPEIRKLLQSVVPPFYNASSLIFTLATFSSGNGNIPMGGSRAMTMRMAEKYINLGGKIRSNAEVDEILLKDGVAIGIRLSDGSQAFGSYIVPACDINFTYRRLLKGKYDDNEYVKRFKKPQKYPLSSCVQLAFAVDADLSEYPESLTFETSPFKFGNKLYRELSMQHYCYDKFAPDGKSVIVSYLMTDHEDYLYWRELKDKVHSMEYQEKKTHLADLVIECIEERFPELKDKIKTLDVATPVTYENYCNAFEGAWMAFAMTPRAKQMAHNGKVKGIKNLYMAGQWLMPPGGLPCALVTGKWAIQRICKKEKIPFEWRTF